MTEPTPIRAEVDLINDDDPSTLDRPAPLSLPSVSSGVLYSSDGRPAAYQSADGSLAPLRPISQMAASMLDTQPTMMALDLVRASNGHALHAIEAIRRQTNAAIDLQNQGMPFGWAIAGVQKFKNNLASNKNLLLVRESTSFALETAMASVQEQISLVQESLFAQLEHQAESAIAEDEIRREKDAATFATELALAPSKLEHQQALAIARQQHEHELQVIASQTTQAEKIATIDKDKVVGVEQIRADRDVKVAEVQGTKSAEEAALESVKLVQELSLKMYRVMADLRLMRSKNPSERLTNFIAFIQESMEGMKQFNSQPAAVQMQLAPEIAKTLSHLSGEAMQFYSTLGED